MPPVTQYALPTQPSKGQGTRVPNEYNKRLMTSVTMDEFG